MKPKSNVEFHPTLVIGLGGTGYGVLLELKKRLLEQFDEIPPIIQFLSIDTAEPTIPVLYTSEGDQVNLELNKDRFIFRVEDPSSVLSQHNHYIEEWWPSGTLVSEIISGATQIRARGRLALFANYIEIRDLITSSLNEIRKVENTNLMLEKGFQPSQRRKAEVYIVSSLAGGTGSGMFMDVGFITRNLLASANITGMFVLPRVFAEKPGTDLIRVNTYAALKEIEYFSKLRDTDRVSIDYGSNKIQVRRSPFDLTYIIDSMNEQEKVINEPEVLFPRVAHGIYLQIGSEIGVSKRNVMDNINNTLDSAGIVKNRSVRYCSFGVSSCTWRYRVFQRLYEGSKFDLARKLIADLLKKPTATDYKDDVKLFMQNRALTPGRLEDLMRGLERQGEEQKPLGLEIQIEGKYRFDKETGWQVINESKKFVGDAREKIRTRIEGNYPLVLVALKNSLNEWQREQISQPGFLTYTPDFMKHLSQAVRELLKEVEKRGAENETRLKDVEGTELINLDRTIAEVSKAWFSAQRKMREACINYGGKIGSQCRLILKEEQYRKTADLLNGFLKDIESVSAQCTELKSKLDTVSDNLMNNQTQYKASASVFEVEDPFEQVLPSPPLISDSRLDPEQFMRWHSERHQQRGLFEAFREDSVEEVEKRIMDFIHENSGVSSDISIGDALDQMEKEGNPLDMTHLSHLAAPLWRYNSSELPTDRRTVHRLAYCSVEDRNQHHLRNAKGGWFSGADPEFIPAMDAHHITFFNVTIGVPLFALNGMRDMESEYNKFVVKNPACHLHRDWREWPDIIPRHPTSDLCSFVVAQAPGFELVRKNQQGKYTIYLEHDSSPVREIPLGDELETAYSTLAGNKEVVKKMREAIEKIMDEKSWQSVKNSLERYADDLSRKVSGNGSAPSNNQFTEKEIAVIQDYLTEIG